MTRELPTIRGHRINSSQSFPERPYVYSGDDRYVPPPPPDPDAPQCSLEGCGRRPHAKGYCNKHYFNLRVYGTPHIPDRRRKENRNASNGAK